MQIFM